MTETSNEIPKFLRRERAAQYVRQTYGFPCSPKWLAKLAVIGGGPTFQKAGRTPLYTREDLDHWAQARIGEPRVSTRQAGQPVEDDER